MKKFRNFAKDFGFVEEKVTKERDFFRGYGRDPYIYVAAESKDGKPRFRGPALVAATEGDFGKASRLKGAVVGSLNETPGGGKIVTFNRPDDTFFHVIFGQEEREIDLHESTATHEQQGPYNTAFEKPRQRVIRD